MKAEKEAPQRQVANDNSNFSQSEFLSAICHELKTPLGAIISFSQALQDDIANPDMVKSCGDYAHEINSFANDLNELIHDLLDVGQSLSGNFSVDLSKEIDVGDVVKRAVRINHDYALKRGIALSLGISDKIKPVKLDEKRMKQIVSNLISNAVKYSPNHHQVFISVKETEAVFFGCELIHAVEISVRDQGFGMTQEQVAIAFSKYGTVENPNRGKVDSFGFGLPIVKQLVEAQRGMIEVKSEVGVGTEVRVVFPVC